MARRTRWLASLACLATVGGSDIVPAFGSVALYSGALAAIAFVMELSIGTPLLTEGKASKGAIAVDDGGHVLLTSGTRKESLARSMIEAGWTEEPDHVVLSLTDGRRISIEVKNAEDRERFLPLLGVSAADRVLRVPVYSTLGSVPGGELMGAIACLFAFPTTIIAWIVLSILAWKALFVAFGVCAVFAATLTAVSWLLLQAFRSRQVVVGTDGVVIEGLRRKPIPFAEIEDVSEVTGGISLRKKNGTRIRLPTGRRDPAFPTPQTEEQAARAHRLLERIREALALYGKSGQLDQKASWLECGSEDAAVWRARLHALGTQEGDYRRPGISNDDLLEIARDGKRSVGQRAGALYVLGQRKAELAAAEKLLETCADAELSSTLRDALAGVLSPKTAKRALRYRIVDAELEAPTIDEAAQEESDLSPRESSRAREPGRRPDQ